MLSFTTNLKEAGVPPKIAEAQAHATLEVILGLLEENLATKQDFQLARQDLMLVKSELANPIAELDYKIKETGMSLELKIANSRTELGQKIADLRAELKQEIADLRTELKQEIADLRTEFKIEINKLDKRLTNLENHILSLENRLIIRLGLVTVGSVTFVGTVLGILFHFIH